jgi:hypothetical protein
VRWLEVLATAAYWWHPVCWWARRALREAEEQCCDAWVLWARPGGLPAYAAALLETLDFLSARPGSDPPGGGAGRVSRFSPMPVRSAVPALASGMGQFHQLKRRFVMLKQGDVPRALTRGGLMTVFTLGGLMLPVVPTFAQVLAPTPAVPATPATPAAPEAPVAAATPAPAPKIDSPTPADDQGSAREDGDDERASKRDAADRQKLDELKRARDFEQSVRDKRQQADLQKQLAESKAEVQKLAAALAQAQDRLRQLERSAGVRSNGAKFPDGGITSMKPGVGFTQVPIIRGRGGSIDSDDGGDRLDAIEQQLQGLLKEVKSMRAERKAEDKARSKDDGKPTGEKGYWKNDGKPKDGPSPVPPEPRAR